MMARPKRNQWLITSVRGYLRTNAPELASAPLHVRMLDGPPGGPRYVATVERCTSMSCERRVIDGWCGVDTCPLRHSLRLLLDYKGNVIRETEGGHHWE